MNQRSHIILCMSRNKIFAGDESSSQQDLAPTTRRKSVHAFIKLCCYFYDMATMKKIILCVLLSFFFSIYSTTHVHSCRDPGIQTTGVATTGGVPDHSTGLPFHPWIMTVAANEKRRKQQQESLARCRGKEVLSVRARMIV